VNGDRLLVIDADLPKRLAVELNTRCRRAVHVATLDLARDVKDPELLRRLAAHYEDQPSWVLITGDDRMPAQHGTVIEETAATIATIHPIRPQSVTEDGWYRDVVHRWAHAMQQQAPQTVRRYTFANSQIWKPRRSHARQIAAHGWPPWTPSKTRSSPAPAASPSESAHVTPQEERLPGVDWQPPNRA
jgi:hypothetical protein